MTERVTMDIERKRLDSLARNRASAELKLRYPEEWSELRAKILNELLVERALIGEVTRSRTKIKHSDGGDGTCQECGQASPCEMERKRIRQREARKLTPVNTDDE